jgi:hypothetical protein
VTAFGAGRGAGRDRDTVVATLQRELLVPFDAAVAESHLDAMLLEFDWELAPTAVPQRNVGRRAFVGAGVVAAALTFTGGFAVAGALPTAAQHWLSRVSSSIGITLPDPTSTPAPGPPRPPAPPTHSSSPGPAPTNAPGHRPRPDPTGRVTPAAPGARRRGTGRSAHSVPPVSTPPGSAPVATPTHGPPPDKGKPVKEAGKPVKTPPGQAKSTGKPVKVKTPPGQAKKADPAPETVPAKKAHAVGSGNGNGKPHKADRTTRP